MKKIRSVILMLYLICSFFVLLFIMSLLFQTFGYWVNGGGNIIFFVKDNFYLYLKVGIVGFFVGFVLWLFNVR
ncbi:Uncharacterised protein [Serratia proteamaculans]|nr:Uncharacterised protein [Serratia proteamaculans]CAI1809120.1 Uncharacterised protein [Serratia proteamaculans]CAI1827863.1 Uncharacterised protein [Serratia proteamaculans]CAI1839809.1 Uncharacterised protein [Serratia proteamaculans]CAI1844244.1 Uncharacterised protein [Serratia proteamaculans]